MERAITRLSICPIRAQPDDASEMVSQLLFGEEVDILDYKKPSWVRVRCAFDGYEGWMDQKQIETCEPHDESSANCIDLVEPVFSDGNTTYATMGATLPGYDGMTAAINGHIYRFSGHAIQKDDISDVATLIDKLARKWLNTPYLWGGRSPFGVDCSGLTQVVYKCAGMALPRDSKDQADLGSIIDFFAQCQTGDLAFFSQSSAQISHVGIILADNSIIHASGKVRIDFLDHFGIFNRDIQEYTHKLKIIKRVV